MQPRHFMLGVVLVAATMAGAARVAGDTINTGVHVMAAKQDIGEVDIAAEGQTSLTKRFGAPKTESFTLTKDIGEFRIELLNFFKGADLKTDPPQITEATWSVSATQNLTVWYRQGETGPVYIHHMIWHKGQEF